eukprot:1176308-Prorocentrum_minimum.AAC.6
MVVVLRAPYATLIPRYFHHLTIYRHGVASGDMCGRYRGFCRQYGDICAQYRGLWGRNRAPCGRYGRVYADLLWSMVDVLMQVACWPLPMRNIRVTAPADFASDRTNNNNRAGILINQRRPVMAARACGEYESDKIARLANTNTTIRGIISYVLRIMRRIIHALCPGLDSMNHCSFADRVDLTRPRQSRSATACARALSVSNAAVTPE